MCAGSHQVPAAVSDILLDKQKATSRWLFNFRRWNSNFRWEYHFPECAKSHKHMGTSKNRRERQQIRSRSAAVREYSEHRRTNLQRAAGFSTFPYDFGRISGEQTYLDEVTLRTRLDQAGESEDLLYGLPRGALNLPDRCAL
jgi:hypothetical protein